jgi:DNA repair protein RadC
MLTKTTLTHTMRDMPTGEQPRERLRELGAAALADSELLAILLRTGVPGITVLDLARDLLVRYEGLPGLQRASFEQLCQERGLGEAKTAQLKAALELGRRLLLTVPGERLQIRSPTDVAALLMVEMGHLEQEQLRVLHLNTRHQVTRQVTVYQGSVNTALVRVGELFREAVRDNAAAVILCHNHPSGSPEASPEDLALTREAVEAGRLLDIEILDHIIVGHGHFLSMRERGLGFSLQRSG